MSSEVRHSAMLSNSVCFFVHFIILCKVTVLLNLSHRLVISASVRAYRSIRGRGKGGGGCYLKFAI